MRSEIILGSPGYYGTGSVLITRDYAPSRKNRYSVFYIPSSPSKRIKIIGRELPLGLARKIANNYLNSIKEKCSKRLKKAIKNDKDIVSGKND